MPSKKFVLDKKNNEDLEIKWKWNFQEIMVYYGIKKLWIINKKEELKNWKSFELESGSILKIRIINYLWFIPELEIFLDWEILPGSPTDPILQIDQVFWLIAVIGWLNILLGILWSFGIDVLSTLQVGFISIIYGWLLLILDFWFKKKCKIYLWMIVVLWLLELIYWGYLIINGVNISIGWLIIKVVILVFMLRWFSAIKNIKRLKS